MKMIWSYWMCGNSPEAERMVFINPDHVIYAEIVSPNCEEKLPVVRVYLSKTRPTIIEEADYSSNKHCGQENCSLIISKKDFEEMMDNGVKK